MDLSSGASPAQELVGRSRERARLREAFAAAVQGQGCMVLVSGEAGIGKTALVDELAATAGAQDALVLAGHCYDLSVTPPYGPWVEIARRYHPSGELPEIPAFLNDTDALAALGSQERIFRAVVEFFLALAAAQPLVLILEDLHWADPASLDLLRVLAREVRAQPLLLVATYRSDELTRRHPLYQLLPSLVREASALRLELHPLPHAAQRRLLATRYTLMDDDLLRLETYLAAHAEGNPLYIVELLRTLEADGELVAGERIWCLGDLGHRSLPAMLLQLIEARLYRLTSEARRLLEVASVIGPEVPLALWQRVSAADDGILAAAVAEGLETHLLLEGSFGAVRFGHALMREALYQGIDPVRRRSWHHRIAALLAETRSPDPDLVAHHFEQAGDGQAFDWLVRAGERAQLTYAWLTAIERYERALRVVQQEGMDERQLGWLSYRIARLPRYGTPQQSIDLLDRVLQVAEHEGDAALAAAARYTRGLCRFFAGDFVAAVSEMTEGADALEALPPEEQARLDLEPDAEGRPVVANPRGMLVTVLANTGHLREAVRMGESTREGSPGARRWGSLAGPTTAIER